MHINEIVDELHAMALDYLKHYFFVINDRVYWKKLLESTPYYTLWLDCSQNIALTEKGEVHSAHFSGKQQTLHNILFRTPSGNNVYVYHLSDDTNHDSVMAFKIIEDISILRFSTTICLFCGQIIVRNNINANIHYLKCTNWQ